MTYIPVTVRKRGQWEPKEYYKVRAKIMKECYLKGWNPKMITGYFLLTVEAFYKYNSVHKLKKIKYERAYNNLILRDLILKDNGKVRTSL